jgi:hypothetical protein
VPNNAAIMAMDKIDLTCFISVTSYKNHLKQHSQAVCTITKLLGVIESAVLGSCGYCFVSLPLGLTDEKSSRKTSAVECEIRVGSPILLRTSPDVVLCG